MKIEKIKPIPKYMLKLIQKADAQNTITPSGRVRFYSYLTKNDGELVKVTVACKNRGKRWRCKQVIIHGVHSDKCFLKDICQNYMNTYSVGWYEEGLQKSPKWYEYEEWGWNYDERFNICCPILNIEYALRFPKYKYSAVNLYQYYDTFKYLRIYEEYPQAEYLVKLNLSYLATSKVILKKVGKDKNFRKWLIQNSAELARKQHFINIILRTYKEKSSLHYNQSYAELEKAYKNFNTAQQIVNLIGSKDRFFDYIIRHDTNLLTYYDYYTACNHLHLDMTDTKNLMPIDFKRWHDIRIDEYSTAKALKDAEERKELFARFAIIAEKYLPLQRNDKDTFIVVIAKSPQDLIHEGELLNHCVGRMNYDQRFIREESLIFFIRNKETPDTPFVTVEYSLKNHKVLQCYGYGDTRPDEQVLDFVNNKWLPYANKKIKKIEKANKQAA